MAINVADVVTQFGAYYKPGSDNEKNLRNMIYKAAETSGFFQPRPTEDTIWRGTLSSLSRVVQPFQKAFTPIGTTTFKPNQFDLFKVKIDVEENPDDLEASYLGFLTAMDDQDRSKWPFVRFWIENHILPKKEEDLETVEYFTGVYAAPTAGTAGAAGTAMNGLRKVIRGYNTAGRTNLGNGAITMGAPAAAAKDFCTQIETLVESIPSQFRSKLDFLFMSKELELKYKRGKRDKYGLVANYLQTKEALQIEDFPNISVQGLESHTGSNLIWTTIPMNRIRPMKKAVLGNSLKVESAKRVVSAYTDWWEALNFEVPEFVFHNDQDLVQA